MRVTIIGLLGVAFKGGTDDLRNAPALTLIDHLNTAVQPAAMWTSRLGYMGSAIDDALTAGAR